MREKEHRNKKLVKFNFTIFFFCFLSEYHKNMYIIICNFINSEQCTNIGSVHHRQIHASISKYYTIVVYIVLEFPIIMYLHKTYHSFYITQVMYMLRKYIKCLKKFGSWFWYFTMLSYEFGHLIGTTWSSETWIGSVVSYLAWPCWFSDTRLS